MYEIEHGEYQDPWRGPRPMTEEPWLHPTAIVRASRLGVWTMVGERCEVVGSELLDYAYLMREVEVFNADIGKFANIASHVRINPTNHPMWRASLHHFTYRSRSHFMGDDDDPAVLDWRLRHRVTIGPDVWIGHGAILLPGVTVGTGAVIGSGAVVTKPVPDYAVAAGNPARLLRRRVGGEVEAALKRIAWWDWPRERLIETVGDFRKLDVEQFAARYDPG